MSIKEFVLHAFRRLFQTKDGKTENQEYPKLIVYQENPEAGPKNFSEKIAREKKGDTFEWPNMVALNKAVARFIGDEKKIVNIGTGTGTFEWFVSVDRSLQLVASEFDEECVRWCKEHRQRENICYCSYDMKELRKRFGKFDLSLAIDVIEHIGNYGIFLRDFSQLADRAIITTPNKARSVETLTSPPAYYQHVREWTAGEFYWILKIFYSQVEMYSMPDIYLPDVTKISLLSTMTPLIAICSKSSHEH